MGPTTAAVCTATAAECTAKAAAERHFQLGAYADEPLLHAVRVSPDFGQHLGTSGIEGACLHLGSHLARRTPLLLWTEGLGSNRGTMPLTRPAERNGKDLELLDLRNQSGIDSLPNHAGHGLFDKDESHFIYIYVRFEPVCARQQTLGMLD